MKSAPHVSPRLARALGAVLVALALTSTLIAGPALARPARIAAHGTMLVDDYPYKTDARGALTDIWRFYNGYCTSFVAWRINDLLGKSDFADHQQLNTSDESYWAFKNFMPKPGGGTVQFGNADTWDDAALALGWTVDTSPAVGSIAQWNAFEGDASSSDSGHVAVVTKVYIDGKVDVEEYNWSNPGGYDTRMHVAAPRFIHVPGVPSSASVSGDVAVAPYATSSAYVRQTYQDVLGRPATPAEVTGWAGKINGGTAPGQLVSTLLTTSPFSTASSPIVRSYLAYFQRGPDLGGYDYWVGRLVSGSADPYWVSDFFATSDEFTSTYGNLDDPHFVDLVYKNVLNRTPDPGGEAYWIAQLGAGVRRGAVMTQFAESDENVAATQTRVDSARMYLALLQRTPDQGGWSYWATQLGQGMSLSALADTFRAFPEYAKRVGASTGS